MSLRYALLGFLSTEPASGYRLSQEFGESAGWFWYAQHSQIHPELKRLEAAGLIESSVDPDDARGTKTFTITKAGLDDLNAWLEGPTEYPPLRDVERTRLLFLDSQPVEVVRKHFESHIDHHQRLLAIYEEQLAQLEAGTFPRLVKRLASQPKSKHDYVAGLKRLAMEGNVRRARTEIEWAQECLGWLESLDRRGKGGKR